MLDNYETWDVYTATKQQERSQDRLDLEKSELLLESSLPL